MLLAKETVGVPTAVLGVMQRGSGLLQQGIAVPPVVGIEADADAGGHDEAVIGNLQRLAVQAAQ
jgi:hypothetical protein